MSDVAELFESLPSFCLVIQKSHCRNCGRCTTLTSLPWRTPWRPRRQYRGPGPVPDERSQIRGFFVNKNSFRSAESCRVLIAVEHFYTDAMEKSVRITRQNVLMKQKVIILPQWNAICSLYSSCDEAINPGRPEPFVASIRWVQFFLETIGL